MLGNDRWHTFGYNAPMPFRNIYTFTGKLLGMIATDPERDSGYIPLENYGIIGNLETVALITNDGSIDWMCLPHLESGSVFTKLLDATTGGSFVIQPNCRFESRQHYLGDTNVLQTHFTCESGSATLTDFMPPFKKRTKWHKYQVLFRKIEVVKGSVPFRLMFDPRFDYARTDTILTKTESGVVASSATEKIYLDTSTPCTLGGDAAYATFTVDKDEEWWAVMQYNSHDSFTKIQRQREYLNTVSYWDTWRHTCDIQTCVFRGPWHHLVVRSGLVLKLLTHGETGAIAAAATTSLPEAIGAERNWDYRFNWIRDSVFTAQALYNLGHRSEANRLLNWYKKIYKKVRVSDIAIMHGLHGEPVETETSLVHLDGYLGSKPVRIGNGAANQKQLDIYGELLSMAYETTRFGETISSNDWKLLKRTADHVCNIWNTKDSGIWEVRGKERHYVFSKIMCWVALDRAIKIAVKKDLSIPSLWEQQRKKLRTAILKRGFNKRLNSFVQAFGSPHLDATNLLIPIVGFLPIDDPRVKGTITASKKKLMRGGLVDRYNSPDGLTGEEGTFVMCSFWLVDALALSGKVKEAETLFKRVLSYASPLGLFAEEIDTKKKMQLGNFPQAFSHTALINSALYIGIAKGKQPAIVGPSTGFSPLAIFRRSVALLKKKTAPFPKSSHAKK